MSSLPNAIAELEAEIASFNQGSKAQPKDGSTEWFLLRAKAVGIAYLKRVEQLGIAHDAGACERVYKKCSVVFKSAEVPAAPEVDRETLPDGSLPTGVV